MRFRQKSLTPSLHAALAGYRNAYETGGNVRATMGTVLSQLATQPPATIASADGEIANVAGLTRWRPKPTILQRIFGSQTSESRLLLKTPGLEYLYIFHRDGRLREQALKRIHGPLPNAFIVAALTWRLNDWVLQVRESSVSCAKRCFDKTDPQIIARFFLSTLSKQSSWGRWSYKERELVTEQIKRIDVTAELARILLSETNGPLPTTLAYVIQFSEFDCHLESLAKNAAHPGIRGIALRALIESEAKFANGMQWRWIDKPMGRRRMEPRIEKRNLTVAADRETLYVQGLKDKSAIVRRIALSGMIKYDRHKIEYQKLARNFLSDPSPSVRSRAEFILKPGSAI